MGTAHVPEPICMLLSLSVPAQALVGAPSWPLSLLLCSDECTCVCVPAFLHHQHDVVQQHG